MYLNFSNQILVGTILGGSSLVRPSSTGNYYLSMRGQNEKWLQYKMEEMPKYFHNSKMKVYGKTFVCNSPCMEYFTELHSVLYEGNKRKMTMEILDSLHDTGLAVWFLDGGSKTGRGRKNAYINTTKFGELGTQIVQRYFNEIDMECNINRDGKRIKVLFTVEGTESLLKTIAHRFPVFMHHRV